MFKRIAEIVFQEFFKETIEKMDSRIVELEKQTSILQQYLKDNKEDTKNNQEEIKQAIIQSAKIESTLKTMMFLNNPKKSGNAND